MSNINVEGELYVPAVELHKCQDEYAALKQGMDSVCEEYGHLEEDYEALRAEIERLRELVESAYRDGWLDGSVRDPFGNVGPSDDWERSDTKVALAGKEDV